MTKRPSEENNEANSKTVAVFLYDGSQKYSDMTLNAIRSFLRSTANCKVGILVNPGVGEPDWQKVFPDHSNRLDVRSWKKHFEWNPTQHKLDLQEFTDNYDTILWIDSDTVTYQDMGPFIKEFQASACTLGLVPDLVITKPNFQHRWSQATGSLNPNPFVPQCAFMIFKKEAIAKLFPVWKSIWRKWTEPSPFTHYGDPDPEFQGSAFCIEQYALGLALEQLNLLGDGSLYIIGRRQLVLKDGSATDGTAQRQQTVPQNALYTFGGSSYQGGGTTPYSFPSGSYQGVGSYQLGSYGGSQQLGSYQLGSYQLGSYQLGSYQAGSLQGGSYQLGGTYQLDSSYGQGASSNQQTKIEPGTANVGFVSIPSGLERDIVVDSFAGGVVHFYSFNYGPGYNAWNQNQQKIEGTLNELWKK